MRLFDVTTEVESIAQAFSSSMPKCINIPRIVAEMFSLPLDPEKVAWISIHEPDDGKNIRTHTKNEHLDKLNNLKLKFWDLKKTVIYKGETLLPPSKSDAAAIVDFILMNKGKSFMINCAAGVSRSGAVCLFLETCMGYSWEANKQYAQPNPTLFNLMREYYDSKAA